MKCAGCDQQFTLAPGRAKLHWEIDHIVPWCLCKSNERSNLHALCHGCHKGKTARERKTWATHSCGVDLETLYANRF